VPYSLLVANTLKMTLSKLQFSNNNFYLVTVTRKIVDKKIVDVTKNDCYFKRYDCGLYRKKARLSV